MQVKGDSGQGVNSLNGKPIRKSTMTSVLDLRLIGMVVGRLGRRQRCRRKLGLHGLFRILSGYNSISLSLTHSEADLPVENTACVHLYI